MKTLFEYSLFIFKEWRVRVFISALNEQRSNPNSHFSDKNNNLKLQKLNKYNSGLCIVKKHTDLKFNQITHTFKTCRNSQS